MKPQLMTVFLVVAASAPVFAQGRINVLNDASSLVMLTPDTAQILAADAALAGMPVGNSVPLPSGVTLVAGLYGGTSATALYLYSQTTLNVTAIPAGYIPAFHVVLNAQSNGAPAIPGIPNGTAIGPATPWFQVRIWDGAYPSFDAALAAARYVSWNPLFQMNPNSSAIAYTGTTPPGPNSTWSETPFVIPVPEPSALSLAALGVIGLSLYRRRKR
jgi:hypothetical protein